MVRGEKTSNKITIMNRSPKLYGSIIVLLFLSISINCQAVATGTDSLFELPQDARSLGMGKVSVGLSSELTGPFYDPAEAKESRRTEVSSLYANQLGELGYTVFTLHSGKAGLSYRRLCSGELTQRDLQGNPTGESFRYYSQGLTGRIGRSFGPTELCIKGNILQKEIGEGFLGGSFSPGFIYEISPIRFGAVMSNLVAGEISSSEDAPRPWREELTFGLGFERGNFKAGFDVEAEFHDRGVEPNGFRAGAEWWITRFAAIRLGVMDELRSTIGWGIRGENIQIDYAYLQHGGLPSSHFISFSWFVW